MLENIFWLGALAVVSFVQNMAFTWTSRSRNSADLKYHAYAAVCSNGIWLLCTLLVWKQIWGAFEGGNWAQLVPMFFVYVAATAGGSVTMMHIALRTEKGKRQVGARD